MRVAFDTNILSLLLSPGVEPPRDPTTGKPVERAVERIQLLIDTLEEAGARAIIPATVVAEFLVVTDAEGANYLTELNETAVFDIQPFDQRAAIEAAADQLKALKVSGAKKASSGKTRDCIKADRQIVAVAKVNNVDRIYTTDRDVKNIAERMGVPVTMLWELPIPDPAGQQPDLPDLGEKG